MRTVWKRIGALLVAALLAVPVGTAVATEHGAAMAISGTSSATVDGRPAAAARQDDNITILGARFRFDEPVGLWITWPDGRVVGLDDENLQADHEGRWRFSYTPDGTLPTGVHYLSARGKISGRGAIVPLYLMAGTADADRSGEMRLVPERARQLEAVELYSSGFNANEPVSLWLTRPDGVVVGLGVQRASQDGRIALEQRLPGSLPVGTQMFSARGNASNVKATATFELLAGTDVATPVVVSAIPGSVQQRSTIEVNGTGFEARESISVWLTKPNGAVVGFDDRQADAAGQLNSTLYLSEALPVGTYDVSVRGNRSGQVHVVRVMLEAGPQNPGQE